MATPSAPRGTVKNPGARPARRRTHSSVAAAAARQLISSVCDACEKICSKTETRNENVSHGKGREKLKEDSPGLPRIRRI
ncbi:hypothetical protein DBR06_SOUSAS5010012 [Sousa chinensis]|nr:hypothetical protein DBR06_SOUSAS5010012 [Sousa chinensis]